MLCHSGLLQVNHGTIFHMRIRLLLASLSLALLSACGSDQTSNSPPAKGATAAAPISAAQLALIDSYVKYQMATQRIPGLTLVVSLNGQPVLEKGYGVSNIASSTPATPATVFRIGSVTKQFTASAIMLLVQDGRIKLDDKVSRYLPTAPASWNAITIGHLLQHTSGLQRDLPASLLTQVNPEALPTIDGLISMAGKFPLEHQTGAVHSYSNVGYHVLGFVIEKVTGQYFADFLQQRVFGPLGMTSADVIRTTKTPSSMATGYLWDGRAHRPASSFFLTPGFVEAEGNLQMSATDLAKWDAALLTERILTKASLAQMWTPAMLNDGTAVGYGFGWSLEAINKRPYTSHGGSVEGFTSSFARHTNEGISVIVLDNLNGGPVTRIGAAVAAIIKPELAWVSSADPKPATGLLLRALVDELKAGAMVVDDRFAPQLKAILGPQVVAGFVDFFVPWAPIDEVAYIDQVSVNDVTMGRYLVRAKHNQLLVGIALDANGKVIALMPLSE